MNALLRAWDGEFGLPPFAAISDADFAPAFDAALVEARANIAAITAEPQVTFANTIEAMELAEGALDRVGGVFYNLAGADSTDAREALQMELAPKMSAFASEVTNNTALFGRIEDLWQRRDELGADGGADAGFDVVSADVCALGGVAGRGRGRAVDGGEVAVGGVGHDVQPEPSGG